MKKLALLLFLGVSLSLTSAAVAAGAQTVTPQALVSALYRDHNSKTRDPFFQTKSRAQLDKYFVKSLADLIWNDQVTSAKNNEVGTIDGDPLYDAQDFQIKKFLVHKATISGDTAVVPVTFTNMGKYEKIQFHLKRVERKWKVDDIEYSSGTGTLRSWFKQT